MENLIAAVEQFATAADYAQAHDVTKHQFVALFDEANGYPAEDIDYILAGIKPSVAIRIETRLGAGIRHLDGLSFEHTVDAFDEWCRESKFFDALKNN